MNTLGHRKFILTPIFSIIEDTISACMSLGNGMEVYPLGGYIMQSTFLRMTGASEQKLKCLCWETATFDYEFRYAMLRNPLGECSSYEDKRKIFRSVCESLGKYGVTLTFTDDKKDAIIRQATARLLTTLQASPLSRIFEKEFLEFKRYYATNPISRTSFCNHQNGTLNFLESSLQSFYGDYVYRQRNRYAHNLTSYQMNIPTLTQLLSAEPEKSNHFRMYSILILMDEIFMELYRKFEEMKMQHSY